jgi:hypothetical protein
MIYLTGFGFANPSHLNAQFDGSNQDFPMVPLETNATAGIPLRMLMGIGI